MKKEIRFEIASFFIGLVSALIVPVNVLIIIAWIFNNTHSQSWLKDTPLIIVPKNIFNLELNISVFLAITSIIMGLFIMIKRKKISVLSVMACFLGVKALIFFAFVDIWNEFWHSLFKMNF
ncbi:MAG TPA: hypothetical protein VF941_17475 [Clostridia bacterium]